MLPEIIAEAQRRELSHARHASNRNLANGAGCLKGLAGEMAFAKRYGLPLDLTPRLAGDAGRDFLLPTDRGVFPVDVKTAEIAKWLLVDVAACKRRTIYVLARYNAATRTAALLGWEWGSRLMATEPGDYGRKGVISYALLRRCLRPMSALDQRAKRLK